MALAVAPARAISLADKYDLEAGLVYLSGVQALVRVALDQARADRTAGLRTGTLISGYQGSPLGGYDQELARNRERLDALGVVHRPALNEELGATSVWGSQLAPRLPKATVDGVVGWWYGKAPGVDRAADALRHGNFVGAGARGGIVALAGDDPAAKSSTLPSATEATLAALGMPVLYPGSVQEALDLGRHAVALSRSSGLWTALKVVTAVADAASTAYVGLDRVRPVLPMVEFDGGPYVHQPDASLLAPASVAMERTLNGPRLELARAYGYENRLNRTVLQGDELGVVAAGTTYHDLREALRTLGVDGGVRVLHVQQLWPMEARDIRDFARGLRDVVVLEEKGGLLATAVREALYDLAERPRIHAEFHPVLEPDAIARVIGPWLDDRESVRKRLAFLERTIAPTDGPLRTPVFCSGCPHNRSTEAPDDASVGLGIGCHTMALIHRKGKGLVTGLTQMGGEGAQWIGQAPFTARPHSFQNLGDGTFHHSGSLAVRAAVAAGVNITYKLLFNRAVAMTGGQDVEGGMTVEQLRQWFALEGVKRVEVTTEHTPRDELMRLQRELAKVPGVTVLIHDQLCATEKRRAIKRGKLAAPTTRVAINERVCEGCGDCGAKSKCLSVVPVQTPFGRKTQIHQSSCNDDRSCLDGDCPSFLEVVPGRRAKKAVPAPPDVPAPAAQAAGPTTIRMIGIGGTGVVTMAQVVGMAALIDGRQVHGLDQTGLAQKGGPVVSDVRILDHDDEGSNRAVAGGVDAYLGFDLLGAASPANLMTADPDRTIGVVSTHQTPTGEMVVDPDVSFAALGDSLDVIDRHTAETVAFDAQALSEALFGDHMPSNALLLGAAWQRGLIPLSLGALEAAIRLNGAAVDATLAALHWGRATVADPDAVAAATHAPEPAPIDFAAELEAYGNRGLAEEHADFVARVERRAPHLADAVARNLFKLMAYKDEYEVARLHRDPAERARIEAEFGEGARVKYKLHPPALRAMGLQRKLTVGPAFTVLRRFKRLRGTALDPFGRAEVRRVERALPDEYRGLVERALAHPESPAALELCELPDLIRGYEEIKLAGVERFRARADELVAALEAPVISVMRRG